MFDGLYFEYPWFGLLIFVFLLCDKFCKMKVPSIYFPHLHSFAQQTLSVSWLLLFLKYLSIVMMIFGLMSPVKEESFKLDPKDGYELALVLDASQSMQERGFDKNNPYLNRFDVVKSIVSDFVEKRKNDNIGLVVFGAYSFIALPLTYDKHIVNKILPQLQIGMAGKYTALYEALAQGVNLLKTSASHSKVMILLTDGYSTDGVDKIPLDVAIDLAKKEHIKVYPIGIGRSGEYNQRVLLKIAQETGGVAFGASNANELESIYKKIDVLEKSKIQNESLVYLQYFYIYPLFVALLALMLYVYMRNKRG